MPQLKPFTVRFVLLGLLLSLIHPTALWGQSQKQRTLRSSRAFHPVPCHSYRHAHSPQVDRPTAAPRWMMNYDMAPSIARSDTFDIATYELTLDVTEYNLHLLTGHAEIALTVVDTEASDLWFDLVELAVDSVSINGSTTGFVQNESQVHVEALDSGWQTDIDYLVELWYGGSPYADPYWGGFYFVNDYIYNLGIGLTSIPPNFGKVWYPCFDNFVERATYTYHVTSAGGRKAHCQGTFIGETALVGDTVLRSFQLSHPITTHQSAIAVGPYIDSNIVHTGAFGDVPVRLTGKAEHINAMANRFQDLGFAIDALEHWWGPYAWERVGYVLTTDGALEIPTNIAYPQFMVGEGVVQNGGLFSHELGHHWWGDLVAPTIHNHMWIKEGPAEYSSHLFVEWKDGPDAFVDLVKDNQLFVLEEAHLQDGGFFPLSPMPDEHIYGRHTYYKGASVLHNLRAYLGDELFRTGMQSVLATHMDGHMDVDVFESTLEEVTAMDLSPWFDAQILQPGFSTWVIDSTAQSTTSTSPSSTLYLQQKLRACDNYHMAEPLDVTVWDANWNRFDTQISVGGQADEVTLDHPGILEPTFFALNANGTLNQGRMDYTYTISEPEGIQNLPWVAMRVGCDAMPEGDSALVRVEHHWAAPDASPTADYVDELSTSHFWVVDGLWPEGMILDARLQYYGNNVDQLDFDLYGQTEANGFLAWREKAGEPWVEYSDYEWQPGSLANGSGLFRVSFLRKGQYAFAKGDVSASVWDEEVLTGKVTVWPNPASEQISIQWVDVCESVCITDPSGRIVWQQNIRQEPQTVITLDVQEWASGNYLCTASNGASAAFMVK